MITAALSFPVLFGLFGLASDYAMLYKLRTDLQAAADAAALAAAHEMPLAKSNPQQVVSAAKTFAEFQLSGSVNVTAPPPDSGGGGAGGGGGGGEPVAMAAAIPADDPAVGATDSGADGSAHDASVYEVNAEVVDNSTAVKVTISERWVPFFAHFINNSITPIEVEATARYMGAANICVLGLSTGKTAGVTLDNSARLIGKNCAVYSNTPSATGFVVDKDATLESALNCVVGGYEITKSMSVSPTPLTDCPPLKDPLSSRQPPSIGGCDYTSLTLKNENKALTPGVYCGGITLQGTSKVTLSPGVYVIKDGPLLVTESASLTGDGVGFYLTGVGSLVHFAPLSTIDLSAPVDGPLAGLLLFEDRTLTGGRNHKIASNNARRLIGTIYLPVGSLTIDANNPVADQSAYTAIVVKDLSLREGPELVLNTDYDLTDVPVPDGIAGTTQVILSN